MAYIKSLVARHPSGFSTPHPYICRISVVVASLPSKQTARVQTPYATVYMNLPSRGVDVFTKGSNF